MSSRFSSKREKSPDKEDVMSSSQRLANLVRLKDAGDDSDLAAYIVVVDRNVPGITMDWFLDLLTRDKSEEGAGLTVTLVDTETCFESSKSSQKLTSLKTECANHIFLKVSAAPERFAEMSKRSRHLLLPGEGEETQEGLTDSEKQRLVLKELEKLHSNQRETVFGIRDIKLYPGQSILQACHKSGIVVTYFPIHEDDKLDKLKRDWVFSRKIFQQPIRKIRNYFGASVTFYFAFLEFYTAALILPSVIGIIDVIRNRNSPHHQISEITCIFNAIWSAIFLKGWKRRSNELAFDFGTLEQISYEPCRPLFRGKSLGTDPISGAPCPVYPIQKTWLKEYLISIPFMVLSLFVSIKLMIFYFVVEKWVVDHYEKSSSFEAMVMVNIPGVVYAILVSVMNIQYRKVIRILNHYENHRTQSSHDNHMIIKLISFEFCNNFGSIFYVAFWLQDFGLLKYQIMIMLIVYQVLDNLQEVLIPLLSLFKSRKNVNTLVKKYDMDPKVAKIIKENMMPEYDDTYFDYLELFMQFGYVFMFSSVFPLAPVLALFNNVIEKRTDAFKICTAFKRPHQRSASGIHSAWLKAFEVLGYVSVVSNCALIAISALSYPGIKPGDSLETIILTVGIEHLIFALILIINFVVPDCSKEVRINLLRKHFNMKQLLKKK